MKKYKNKIKKVETRNLRRIYKFPTLPALEGLEYTFWHKRTIGLGNSIFFNNDDESSDNHNLSQMGMLRWPQVMQIKSISVHFSNSKREDIFLFIENSIIYLALSSKEYLKVPLQEVVLNNRYSLILDGKPLFLPSHQHFIVTIYQDDDTLRYLGNLNLSPKATVCVNIHGDFFRPLL